MKLIKSSDYATGDQLLLATEIMALLRITRRTLNNYMLEGLPHLKLTQRALRFRLPDVTAWIESRKSLVEGGHQ